MRSLLTTGLLGVLLVRGSQFDAHPANRYVNVTSSRASAPGMEDFDGELWLAPHSTGPDVVYPDALTGSLILNIAPSVTNVAVGFERTLRALIDGRPSLSSWNFGDGTVLSNRSYSAQHWSAAGDYPVVLKADNVTHPSGVSATALVHGVERVHYVAITSKKPVKPYTTWETAATRIQDAIDAAAGTLGATILVSNGVYRTGGRIIGTTLLSRVAAPRPVRIQSVNGPEVTVIRGNGWAGTTDDATAARCVYLGEGATLVGFTLTAGATRGSGDEESQNGGGVWCTNNSCIVSNCILEANTASSRGGGAFGGRLIDCRINNNSARSGGGASEASLRGCTLRRNTATEDGGGASLSDLESCFLSENTARSGGGASKASLRGCTLRGNTVTEGGGGAYLSDLESCFLRENTAPYGGGVWQSHLTQCTLTRNTAKDGGGVYFSTAHNSVIYHNQTPGQSIANYDSYSRLNHCCTTPPFTNGVGNLSVDPQLASESHLSLMSPCRAAGESRFGNAADIDGDAWGQPPSIGCDEPHPGSIQGPLQLAIAASHMDVATDFEITLTARITGQASLSRWDFGDGTGLTNQAFTTTHRWSVPGDYPVTLWAYSDRYTNGLATSVIIQVTAATHYVAVNSTNPVKPYRTWATAATSIQDAIDAAYRPGSTVLVSNGLYQAGGRMSAENGASRVVIDQPLILRSVNGPEVTIIQGYRPSTPTNRDEAVRCVALVSKADLIGFTLTGGASWTSENPYAYGPRAKAGGGGVVCFRSDCVVSNCVLRENVADYGGGAYGGTLYSCTFSSNSAYFGGGACNSTVHRSTFLGNSAVYGGGGAWGNLNQSQVENNSASVGGGWFGGALRSCNLTHNTAHSGGGVSGSLSYLDYYNNCILKNCTISGNTASYNAGVQSAQLNNCIVYYNFATIEDDNHDSKSSFSHSCTTPLASEGVGNIDKEPRFTSSFHLSVDSPCRGAGSSEEAAGEDLDGEAWETPPSIGCDEYHPKILTGPLSVLIQASFTNVAPGFEVQLKGLIDGRASFSRWDFGNGVASTNRTIQTRSWSTPGDYQVKLWAYNASNPDGIAATVTVRVTDQAHYIAADNPYPRAPYDTWETAATKIQDAVDAATSAGATLWISNGVYQTVRNVSGGITANQVSITKPLKLRSVNGPQVTLIDGGGNTRCLYLNDPNISIGGFTLTNGNAGREAGGGIGCISRRVEMSNCIIASNVATEGGGSQGGTLTGCTLHANTARRLGGGAMGSTLNRCVLTGNSSESEGGGAGICILNNSLVTANSAVRGGAAFLSTLNNCTVVKNSAAWVGGVAGEVPTVEPPPSEPGTLAYVVGYPQNLSIVRNSVVYHNENGNSVYCAFDHSCTTPLPSDGNGNMDLPPQFVDLLNGDLRLASNSPCVNAGNNSSTPSEPDLEGQPRIAGGTVDIGAYEFPSPKTPISYGWLQRFLLPTDGSADASDSDDDGHTAFQEWRAGTDPTNSQSALRLLQPTRTAQGLELRWLSIAGKKYIVEGSTNIASKTGFTPISIRVTGNINSTAVVLEPVSTSEQSSFYRVRVE